MYWKCETKKHGILKYWIKQFLTFHPSGFKQHYPLAANSHWHISLQWQKVARQPLNLRHASWRQVKSSRHRILVVNPKRMSIAESIQLLMKAMTQKVWKLPRNLMQVMPIHERSQDMLMMMTKRSRQESQGCRERRWWGRSQACHWQWWWWCTIWRTQTGKFITYIVRGETYLSSFRPVILRINTTVRYQRHWL